MIHMENPAARPGANRVLEIKAFASAFDIQDPIATPSEIQATRAVMRLCGVTVHHARVICELSGLGGAA
ncbi:hypothetical protein ELI41_23240 [Rhizobium leguminosarum]|uniref:hypothetical protein n=1 Tax=Rhizobium leguminosarum TaxID=384 RepID=UPI001031484E|nr:hypothetical protein [Rhizobium leguminosarum]TAU91244.1 hypothetical protein ELI41_23240 [Rhizobium leguminosarum]